MSFRFKATQLAQQTLQEVGNLSLGKVTECAKIPRQIINSHTKLITNSAGKESACNAGDLGSIPGLGRSPAEGKGYPLQYSGLENSMDCLVYGVAKSQT